MPIIVRFSNCAIHVNPRDHNPPHFHIRMANGREAWVAIETLEVLSSSVPRRELVQALEWAANNRELLLAKFKELNP